MVHPEHWRSQWTRRIHTTHRIGGEICNGTPLCRWPCHVAGCRRTAMNATTMLAKSPLFGSGMIRYVAAADWDRKFAIKTNRCPSNDGGRFSTGGVGRVVLVYVCTTIDPGPGCLNLVLISSAFPPPVTSCVPTISMLELGIRLCSTRERRTAVLIIPLDNETWRHIRTGQRRRNDWNVREDIIQSKRRNRKLKLTSTPLI